MTKQIMQIVFTLSLFLVFAEFTTAGIRNSAHDFTASGKLTFQGDSDEICVYCHTPHNAISQDADGMRLPLWNRALPQGTGITFVMYNNSTFNAAGQTGYAGKPLGQSLLCLSCHDGVSSMGTLINYPGNQSTPITWINGSDKIGDLAYPSYYNVDIGSNYSAGTTRDLSDDHPISFAFTDLLVAADQATNNGVQGLNSPGTVKTTTALKLYGSNNMLECTTCHDPHEYGTADTRPFLRMSNAGSGMCLTCHKK